jgi:hypothetical protein
MKLINLSNNEELQLEILNISNKTVTLPALPTYDLIGNMAPSLYFDWGRLSHWNFFIEKNSLYNNLRFKTGNNCNFDNLPPFCELNVGSNCNISCSYPISDLQIGNNCNIELNISNTNNPTEWKDIVINNKKEAFLNMKSENPIYRFKSFCFLNEVNLQIVDF